MIVLLLLETPDRYFWKTLAFFFSFQLSRNITETIVTKFIIPIDNVVFPPRGGSDHEKVRQPTSCADDEQRFYWWIQPIF